MVLAFMLAFGAVGATVLLIPQDWISPLKDLLAFKVLVFGGFIGLMVGFLAGLIFLASKLEWRCPLCQKKHEGTTTYTLIATGRCPHCLESVWNEPELGHPTPAKNLAQPQHSQAEFESDTHRVRYRWQPVVRYLIAAAVVGLVACLLRPTLAAYWVQSWGPDTLPFLNPLLAAPSITIAFWSVIALSRDLDRQAAHIRCPCCSASLNGGRLTAITGNCHRCGSQVIADPLPRLATPVAQRLLTRAELITPRQRYHQMMPWGCIGGGGLAFAYFGLVMWGLDIPFRGELKPWHALVLSGAIVLQIGGVFAVEYWNSRRSCCPNCHRSLVPLAEYALASGNCPHCGHQVIADNDDDNSLVCYTSPA